MPPYEEPGDVFGPVASYLLFTLRAPLRNKGLAAAVLVSCVVAGALLAWALPQKYQVEATILVQRSPLLSALASRDPADGPNPTRAAREIVIRRDNLVALCKQTDFPRLYLATRSPAARMRDGIFETVLRRPRTEADLLDALVSSLRTRLTVWVSSEGAVTIGFVWSDPEIAYRVVEAAVQNFIQARSETEIGALGEAVSLLEGNDTRLQKEIAAAIQELDDKEQALQHRTPAPVRPAVVHRPADEELERLRERLAARRRTVADLEELRQKRLADLQAQLAQLLTVYGPEHPTVIATRRTIETLSAPSAQVTDLKAEIAQLAPKVQERERGAPPEKGLAPEIDGVALARARLLERTDRRLEFERRQVESLLRRHSALAERIEAARLELHAARTSFAEGYPVITPARLPNGPLKPYRLLYAVAGVVAGLLLACVASAARDLWRGVIFEPWQIERELKLPIVTRLRR
jgi:uncharacterized protein involved in exopolysaccharide biosynthesis